MVGRLLTKRTDNAALQIIGDIFMKHVPPVMAKQSWVCVTDVAKAHLLAMKVPEAANQRFILSEWTCWLPEMVDLFNKEFGPQGYTISKETASYATLYMLSFFIKNVQRLLNMLNNDYSVSTEKAQRILGI